MLLLLVFFDPACARCAADAVALSCAPATCPNERPSDKLAAATGTARGARNRPRRVISLFELANSQLKGE